MDMEDKEEEKENEKEEKEEEDKKDEEEEGTGLYQGGVQHLLAQVSALRSPESFHLYCPHCQLYPLVHCMSTALSHLEKNIFV